MRKVDKRMLQEQKADDKQAPVKEEPHPSETACEASKSRRGAVIAKALQLHSRAQTHRKAAGKVHRGQLDSGMGRKGAQGT